jgi:hypothetical protein
MAASNESSRSSSPAIETVSPQKTGYPEFGLPLRHKHSRHDVYKELPGSVWCSQSNTLLSWDGIASVGMAVKDPVKREFVLPCIYHPEGAKPDSRPPKWVIHLNLFDNCTVLFYAAKHHSTNRGVSTRVEGFQGLLLADADNFVVTTHQLTSWLAEQCQRDTTRSCCHVTHAYEWIVHSDMNWGNYTVDSVNPLSVRVRTDPLNYEKAALYGGGLRYTTAPGALMKYTVGSTSFFIHMFRHYGRGIVFEIISEADVQVLDTDEGECEPVIVLDDDSSSAIGSVAVSRFGSFFVANETLPTTGNFVLPRTVKYLKKKNGTGAKVSLNQFFNGDILASAICNLANAQDIIGTYIYDKAVTEILSYPELVTALKTRTAVVGGISSDLWYTYVCSHPELRSVLYKGVDGCQMFGEKFFGDVFAYVAEEFKNLTDEAKWHAMLAKAVKILRWLEAYMKRIGDIGPASPLVLIRQYCSRLLFETVLGYWTAYREAVAKAEEKDKRFVTATTDIVGLVSVDQFFMLNPDCLGLGSNSARLIGESVALLSGIWRKCVSDVCSKGMGGRVVYIDRIYSVEERVYVGATCRGERLLPRDAVPPGCTVLKSGQCIAVSGEYLCIRDSSTIFSSSEKGYVLVPEDPEMGFEHKTAFVRFNVHSRDKDMFAQVLRKYGYVLSDENGLDLRGPELAIGKQLDDSDANINVLFKPLVVQASVSLVNDDGGHYDYIAIESIERYLLVYGGFFSYWTLRIGLAGISDTDFAFEPVDATIEFA